MNRLQYWMRARTGYQIHSPFLFTLYHEVLFARMPGILPHDMPRSARRYHELVAVISDRFSMHAVSADSSTTELAGNDAVTRAMVVSRPHRDSTTEQQWDTLANDPRFNIAIDLYDVGLLLCNHKLRRQQWLLRQNCLPLSIGTKL